MKHIWFVLLIFAYACDSSKQAESRSEKSAEEISDVALSSILEGKWKSEGNAGTVANYLEFDQTSKTFYAWVADDSKPESESGTYKIIGDTILQLSYPEFNYQEHFAFDSVSKAYMDMFSLGVSAGNLVYQKQK